MIKHAHNALVSLGGVQIDPTDAASHLKALGASNLLKTLSHASFIVSGYDRRVGRPCDDDDPCDRFRRTFDDGVNVISKFLARCPALTSLGICEENMRPWGLSLPNLLKHSMPTISNLKSLSVQLCFDDGADFDTEYFAGGTKMLSVRNFQIRTNATDTFTEEKLLSDIMTFFPEVSFLHIAFRFITGYQVGWCGTGRRRVFVSGNEIIFPRNLRDSVTALALDRCFVNEGNIAQLRDFAKLEKLVVVSPTEQVYLPEIGDLYDDSNIGELPDEDIEQYREMLYLDRGDQDVSPETRCPRKTGARIALETCIMDSSTDWTMLI